MSVQTNRNTRSRRGRVLVVGNRPETAALASLFAQPPVQVASMLEAIGEVTSAGASDAIAAVIVAERFVQSPHERAVEALRRVDPSVRVVALGGPPAGTASVPGVDAWLAQPARVDDLRRALDDDGLLAAQGVIDLDVSDASGSIAEAEMEMPPSKPQVQAATVTAAIPEPIVPVPSGREVTAAAPTPPPIVAVSAAQALVATPTPAPVGSPTTTPTEPARSHVAPTPTTTVGDTDLLEALLHSREGVTPLALRLIAHHGGWSDVQINVDASASDGVEIAAGQRAFGRLFAAGASPAQLRPWADWLARWLMMEDEHRRLRHAAHTDDLTGAWNRRFFDAFLADAIATARNERRPVTVMVFDIDNFKVYNDRFGHHAGDEILREIVRLLKSVIRQGDIVCRIGGDEFVVVFSDPEAPRLPGSKHPETAEIIARRFQEAVCSMRFPKLGVEALSTLSVSAGLATFPWDGQDPESLLRRADALAIESKRRGKNAITLGPGIGGDTGC